MGMGPMRARRQAWAEKHDAPAGGAAGARAVGGGADQSMVASMATGRTTGSRQTVPRNWSLRSSPIGGRAPR